MNGDLPVVKYLVEHGADMEKGEAKGITPILIASQFDEVAVVQYLHGKGADSEKAGGSMEHLILMQLSIPLPS
jgi:ankyrin repeat protein